MPVSKPATAAELGEALRDHRKAAGMTLRDLERVVKMSNAKLSLWENGRRLPSLDDLGVVLDAIGVSPDERERLLAMRREAEGPGVLLAGPTTIGAQLNALMAQEEVATEIIEVSPLLIPGLLQTADYARAVFGDEPDAGVRVRLRRGRQEILTREKDPVAFRAFIDDEVLVRGIAPPPVMAEQLRFLLTMNDLPNVTIQLVPSTYPGYTPMLSGPFILMHFENSPPLVHLEHHSASASLWEHSDVRSFMAAVEKISEAAMTSDRTSEVIEELIHGMEKS